MKKIFILALSLIMCLSACAWAETIPEKAVADSFSFDLSEGDELYVENTIFNQTVTISGDNAQIIFANCIFNGDIVNTAGEYTRVMLLPDNVVNGRCVFSSEFSEGHFVETDFPKFITFMPVEVVGDGCYGSVVALGDFEVAFNGHTYGIEDAGVFFDNGNPDAGFVPYVGQEANCFVIAQWWELGARILLVECEFDPSM